MSGALANDLSGMKMADLEIRYFKVDLSNYSTVFSSATYPSLIELSYIKGLTSSIQTQIGNLTTSINNKVSSQWTSGTNLIYYTNPIAIGGTTPNDSAILDLQSITKGFLCPRMTGTQAEAIVSPATGLIVFATAAGSTITSAGWWEYNGSTWINLGYTGV
jgi:hypothetical protein